MRRLPYPVPCSGEAAFNFRSPPSLAHDLVAWLEDSPSGVARPRCQSNRPRLSSVRIQGDLGMDTINIFDKTREMARLCLECIYADSARQEQKGRPYECVKNFAEAVCPFWKIYQAELCALDASAPTHVYATA
jgi:hypothetical protein